MKDIKGNFWVKSKVRINPFNQRIIFLVLFFLSLSFKIVDSSGGDAFAAKNSVPQQEITHRMDVLGSVNWTDTGLDVVEGQEVYFRASGGISLQKGNPLAYCGPDGYDYRGIQQPILSKNIGALIGKVVQLISVEIDEETGEEIRNEVVEMFYVGSENKIIIPLSGSLFLGINENVVGDNSGQFKVEIRLKNLGTIHFFSSF